MEHLMKLYNEEFERVKSGRKTIEVRLFDEKRQRILVGDLITFLKLPNLEEQISVQVLELLKYKSFPDLAESIPMEDFGYPDNYEKDRFVEECYEIYSPEDERKFGVLGIRIKVML